MSRRDRLKTGIRAIDSDEDMNGLESGSLCTIIWEAGGVGELIGFHLCTTSGEKLERKSHYIGNVRSKQEVEEEVERLADMKKKSLSLSSDEGDYELNYIRPNDALPEELTKMKDGVTENDNVVIDDARSLDSVGEVRKLKKIVRNVEGIGYMNIPIINEVDEDLIETLMLSDYVIKLEENYHATAPGLKLKIRKMRGDIPTKTLDIDTDKNKLFNEGGTDYI